MIRQHCYREATNSAEREKSFRDMMELALGNRT